MKRNASITGALFLCALSFLVFGGSNAMATSAYICEEVAKGTGGFTDSHCTKKGVGNFATVKAASTTKIRSTNTIKVTLKFKIGTSTIHIECSELEGAGNVTNEVVGGANQAIGKELSIKIANCTVIEPVEGGCKLKGEGFEIPSAQSSTYMVSETVTGVKISPTSGTTLAKLTFEGCKTSELNGTYTASGSIAAVVNPESQAQLEFTAASSEGGLTIAGSIVTFIVTTHWVVAGTDKTIALENP